MTRIVPILSLVLACTSLTWAQGYGGRHARDDAAAPRGSGWHGGRAADSDDGPTATRPQRGPADDATVCPRADRPGCGHPTEERQHKSCGGDPQCVARDAGRHGHGVACTLSARDADDARRTGQGERRRGYHGGR